jgi:phospholipid/cholesterol/gamma-HCH transport system substrate-binding protein
VSGRRTARAVAAVAVAGVLSGCGFEGVYSLPLPGAQGTGDQTYRVTAQFEDALDLVPFSAVKVQDATVGHVVEVRLVDGVAEVVCQLEDTVRLPANAVSRIAETSLLGEKYVSLDPPLGEPAVGTLADGAVVPLERTMSGATVEEVLGALSLVLNGGGIDQIRTIAVEVNAALTGREDSVRGALQELDTFLGGLDEQKADIIRALEGLERLSGTLAAQEEVIVGALETLPPALVVLRDQRESLTEMLVALGELGAVGTRVIDASREDLVANLRALQPALTQLAIASEDIPKSLDVFATYPFARGVDKYFHGDFGNMWFTIDMYGPSVAQAFGLTGERPPADPGLPGLPLPGLSSPTGPGPAGAPAPAPPAAPGLPLPPAPGVPQLPLRSPSPTSDIAELLFGGLR